MNSYRDKDAQDIQRRAETLAWQEIRRKEEYARTWKCYGAIEVNAFRWRQLPDLAWITEIKKTTLGSHCSGATQRTNRSHENNSRVSLFNDKPVENERIWLKLHFRISVKALAKAVSIEESLIMRMNEISDGHEFQQGDWVVLPSFIPRMAKEIGSIEAQGKQPSFSIESNAPPQDPDRPPTRPGAPPPPPCCRCGPTAKPRPAP